MKIIRDDPAVNNVTGFTGGSRVNSGMMFITLKPRGERKRRRSKSLTDCGSNWQKNPAPAVSDGGTGYSRRRAAG